MRYPALVLVNRQGFLLRTTSDHPLFAIAIIGLAIKLAGFALDQTPLFFMGDSGTYILSAIHHFVPSDRSFTYGLLLRWLAVWPGNLEALILAQVLVSAATAWLLGFTLLYFFEVQPALAIMASVAFCLDPLQILHERLVLTEAFTIFVFAGHLLLALWYLRQPRILTLLTFCITSIVLTSLRLVYAPIVLCEGALLPLLAMSTAKSQRRSNVAKTFGLHLVLGIGISLSLHGGYQYLVGALSRLPPAYQYKDGLILASSWAPLLKPTDATDARAKSVIERQMTDRQYPLGARYLREAQLWSIDGMANRLRRAFAGNGLAANHSAKEMALQALRRDPLAVMHLTWLRYTDYWKTPTERRSRLLVEQGSDRPLPPSFLRELRLTFGSDVSDSWATMTASKRYHLAGGAWYYFLLISPLV
jgi:hypothetical protein